MINQFTKYSYLPLTITVAVENVSPASLNASQVKMPESSGKASAISKI